MGRPKGAKNRRTLVREAEAKAGKLRDPSEIFDTLYMIEVAASYFFRRALEPRKGRKAEQIDQDYRDAAHLAVLAAPFRHSKLTATKILGDPNNPVHFRDDATAEELRAEIMKRLEILILGRANRLAGAAGPGRWNSESADTRRRSIGDQRGVTFARSFVRTVSISATCANAFVSNSAGADQCQSWRIPPVGD